MNAEETENWIEQHSAAAAEWNARKKGRKEKWEVDKAREALESLDTTTEALEP